jgi:hypothetical protein
MYAFGASWKKIEDVLGREVFKSLGEMENNLSYLKLGSNKIFGLVEIISLYFHPCYFNVLLS